MGPHADAGMAHAKELSARLDSAAVLDPATGLKAIPVDTVRRLRQYYDEVAAQAGRYDAKALAEHSSAAAHGMAADAIRGELAKQFPDIAALNREFKFWRDVRQVTDDTILRTQGQAKPLGRKLAGAAGIAGGFASSGLLGAVGGKVVLESLEQAVTSPGWRSVSAVVKDRLANAIAKGHRPSIEFYAKKAAEAARAGLLVDMPSRSAPGRMVAREEQDYAEVRR